MQFVTSKANSRGTMVKISIVIVTWNQRQIVKQCLDSLEQYASDPTVEVVVIDNASADGTPEMVRELYPHIVLLEQSSNLGFAKANNIGLARSSGKYICLINSDVVVPPGCIEKQTSYMEDHADVGMVGPKMRLRDCTIGQSCMGFPTVWNWLCRALALDALFRSSKLFGGYLRTDFDYKRTEDVDVLTGWFWVVRRDALEQVGPLDDRYFFYGEDIDWSKRFHQSGWRVVFYAEAEAIHYCGASSAKAATHFYVEMHRANLQFCKKFYPRYEQALFWLVMCLQEATRILGYGILYPISKSRRGDAAFKIKRSLICLLWLMGYSPNGIKRKELTLPAKVEKVQDNRHSGYVLITAAYNEEAYIEGVLRSVVSQVVPPKRWTIVSDGSTDRTDEIVESYAEKHPFIHLLQIREKHARNFGAQVNAIKAGYRHLEGMEFEFVGNLDADVSFGVDYFEKLIERMNKQPDLGISGGYIFEDTPTGFASRRGNTTRSVPHAVQFFRRECYDSIGGYVPLPFGGPDWCAEISARMKGWRVESDPALPVYHHRPTGGGTGMLRYAFQQGLMDYSLGSHPIYEFLKCARRLRSRPYIIGGLARFFAFMSASVRGRNRPVSPELTRFLRRSEMERLKTWISGTGESALKEGPRVRD
jgi:poly-beta-1,6-N-acetyl-D-glucosamine synthase